jgi:hypothetical protein
LTLVVEVVGDGLKFVEADGIATSELDTEQVDVVGGDDMFR